MGPLSKEDIAFLKEKSNNKTNTEDIKKAFKEFVQDLEGMEGKKMEDVKIDFDQFVEKCDSVFNTSAEIFNPGSQKDITYSHLFRAFDQDQDGKVSFKEFVLGLLILGGSSAPSSLDDEAL